MRLRLALPAALLALTLAPAAAPAAGVLQIPVKIPASMPDDQGRAVTLDGGVNLPSEGCPCPGVIINHGFLGNWTNSGSVARNLAAEGYVVLRYSSRGFGETPGQVDLMGPKERQDLLDAVDWLNDPDSPVVGGKVVRDRIGQFGASYGGAHAWALAASNHPAVRTVVPTATWTDIYDALLPNDVQLLAYVNGFYATGLKPVGAAQENELDLTDNYSQNMHRWIAEANSGANNEDLRSGLSSRSMTGRYGNVNIPVFIVQGLNDGLFSANQAFDAYRALSPRVPTRLYLGGVGHPPSNDSLDSPEARHVTAQVLDWFDRWLKDEPNGIDTRAPIELSRADYFDNRWDGTTRSGWSYPFGPAQSLHLCTTGPQGGTLSADACPDAPPAVAANAPSGGSLFDEPVTAEYAREFQAGFADAFGTELDLHDAPPSLSYDGPVLEEPLDLAGVPSFRLQVASAAQLPAGARGLAAAFQLDPKLYDVAPGGKAKLLTRGAFSEQLDAQEAGSTPQHEVAFDAFGLSNVIPAGHRLRITFQTQDAPFLKPLAHPFAVGVLAGSTVELPGAAGLG